MVVPQPARAPHPDKELPNVLTRQHRRIETLLFQLLSPQTDFALPPAQARFAELAGLLRRHIEIEDRVLFPSFRSSSLDREEGLTVYLANQHREFEWGLDFIWSLISGGAPTEEIRGHLEAFDDILARHLRREEWVVYAVYADIVAAASSPRRGA